VTAAGMRAFARALLQLQPPRVHGAAESDAAAAWEAAAPEPPAAAGTDGADVAFEAAGAAAAGPASGLRLVLAVGCEVLPRDRLTGQVDATLPSKDLDDARSMLAQGHVQLLLTVEDVLHAQAATLPAAAARG